VVILRVLEKVLINTLLIFLLVGGYQEARGEEALFPLINGLFRRYLEIRFSLPPIPNRINIGNYFLINESSKHYFEKLVNMNATELSQEATKKGLILSGKFDREKIISLLIYHHSSKSSIFWEYYQFFPTKRYNKFNRAIGYRKGDKFIIEIFTIGGKKAFERRLIPLNFRKDGNIWSFNDIEEYGDRLKIGIASGIQEFTVKIDKKIVGRKFKGRKVTLYEVISPSRIEDLSYFWYSPECGLVESGDKSWGRMVLIEYFRPDLKKGWRIKLPSKIIKSLYSFGEESLNKKIRDEVEKAWEEKGFKVFYQQEWPEEQTQK